jgi:predicted alpha/beta superfamily hydrolase
MSDDKDRGQTTTSSDQRGPNAPFQQTGISPNVLRELDEKMNPSIAARIRVHLARKGG